MQDTTNYDLKKYDGTDVPNLITGYNASMDSIDAQMKSNENAASAATTTANAAQTKANENAAKLGNGFTSSNTVTAQLAAVKATADAAATSSALSSEQTARETADTAIQNQIGAGFSSSNTIASKIATLENGSFVPSENDDSFDVSALANAKITASGIVYIPASN